MRSTAPACGAHPHWARDPRSLKLRHLAHSEHARIAPPQSRSRMSRTLAAGRTRRLGTWRIHAPRSCTRGRHPLSCVLPLTAPSGKLLCGARFCCKGLCCARVSAWVLLVLSLCLGVDFDWMYDRYVIRACWCRFLLQGSLLRKGLSLGFSPAGSQSLCDAPA